MPLDFVNQRHCGLAIIRDADTNDSSVICNQEIIHYVFDLTMFQIKKHLYSAIWHKALHNVLSIMTRRADNRAGSPLARCRLRSRIVTPLMLFQY